MNAREVLEELDRRGLAVWWRFNSPPLLPVGGKYPPELVAALDEHYEELVKIMRFEEQGPNKKVRWPREPGQGGAE